MENSETGHVAHHLDYGAIDVIKAEGNHILTANGKSYIDFTMGWCVGNLGWSNPDIIEPIRNFDGPFYVSPNHLYRPWFKLADLLITIAPGKLNKCFRATGGTEAVDIAIQAAMHSTRRERFIAIEGAYHGNSLAARALVEPSLDHFLKVGRISPPLDEQKANEIERLLSRRDIAALIMEPIVCNLGVLVPEKIFMTKVQALCREYGTLLIMDEVATGFGRTGKMFACEHFGIEPDIMILAKSITNGVAGLGAVLMTDEVASGLDFQSSFYSTFGWHPLGVEAAIATINYIKKHENVLFKNIELLSEYFEQRLSEMEFEQAPEISIKGLAIILYLEDPDYAEVITQRARKHGLLISNGGNDIDMYPALNIDLKTAQDGLDILERSI